jgi:hypothetical protein
MESVQPPDIITQARNFTAAMAKWATVDGLSVVPDEIVTKRKEICDKCPHWNPDCYTGTGQCNICGCSGLKLYIPSSKCPLTPPKWDMFNEAENTTGSRT